MMQLENSYTPLDREITAQPTGNTNSMTQDLKMKLAKDIVAKERTVQEEQLMTDSNWIEASKVMYELENGVPFDGDDTETAKMGLELMSEFNYNLTLGAIPIAIKLKDATDIQKIAGRYMFETYDQKDITVDGTIRAFKELAQDPSTYLGLGTGIGMIGRQAAKVAARQGLKEATALNMAKYLTKPSTVAAIEGATFTGIDDATRQFIDMRTGAQDEFSGKQNALSTGIGLAAGKTLGAAGEFLSNKLGKMAHEGGQASGEIYTPSLAGGGTPKDLVGQHNLTAKNLAFSDEQGGIPVPSFAISKISNPLEDFGKITMLLTPDQVKPKKDTRVFASDIYSPRYPEIHYRKTARQDKQFLSDISPSLEKAGLDPEQVDLNEIDENVGLMTKFLDDNNMDIPIVRNAMKENDKKFLKYFKDSFIEGKTNREYSNDKAFLHKIKVWLEEQGADNDMLTDDMVQRTARSQASRLKTLVKEENSIGSVDEYKTENSIREAIKSHQEEYTKYVQDYKDSLGVKPTIYSGTDSQGRPKYVAHTKSAVIRHLKKDLQGGENFMNKTANLRGKLASEYKTISEIVNKKDNIISTSDMDKVIKSMDSMAKEVTDKLSKYRDDYTSVDTLLGIIDEARSTSIEKELKDFGFKRVPKSMVSDIKGFTDTLTHAPTEYFEGKILRNTKLDEFSYAVIPSNSSVKTKQILKNNGIEYKEYDPTMNESRKQTIKELAEQSGILFALPAIMYTSGENNGE